MKPIIIFVTGAKCSGKSVTTNWLREVCPYTNMLRLTGNKDKTDAGRTKTNLMYEQMFNYLKVSAPSEMNYIFDGFVMSEKAFCSLGYKDYNFVSDFAYHLVWLNNISKIYDCHYINLVVCDKTEYRDRASNRNKVSFIGIEENFKEYLKQETAYLETYNKVLNNCPDIKCTLLDTSHNAEIEWREHIKMFLKDTDIIKGG